MKFNHYPYTAGGTSECRDFSFVSSGPNGMINKKVLLQKYPERNNTYNLCLGDMDDFLQQLEDDVVSNNGDASLIFFTIAQIVLEFTDDNPQAWIIIHGNTASRRRLYRMYVSKYLELIIPKFSIWGNINGKWEWYRKNRPYDKVLAQRNRLLM